MDNIAACAGMNVIFINEKSSANAVSFSYWHGHRGKLWNGEHLSLEAYKYKENGI